MRHRLKSVELNRPADQVRALLRSLATSLVLHDTIQTTKPKAKALAPVVDRLITNAKRMEKVNAIRHINGYLMDEQASRRFFEEVLPRYADRTSGYTRRVGLGPRKGDGADMVQISFV